ncbi:host cell division inhibitor Icd-like protein [Serratia fonticola]
MIDKKHNTTVFLFASILRRDPKSRPVMLRVIAATEKEARRQLVRDYVLSFAGRLPLMGSAS